MYDAIVVGGRSDGSLAATLPGTAPIAEFFAPDNIAAIVGGKLAAAPNG